MKTREPTTKRPRALGPSSSKPACSRHLLKEVVLEPCHMLIALRLEEAGLPRASRTTNFALKELLKETLREPLKDKEP